MTKKEFEYWQTVTGSSRYHWMEDPVTSRNGRGALYYTGGESGVYIRLTETGHLTVGTYEGAVPHIGEACFTKKAEHAFQDFNEGFQYACQLGGIKFLADLFSSDHIPREGPGMCRISVVGSARFGQTYLLGLRMAVITATRYVFRLIESTAYYI